MKKLYFFASFLSIGAIFAEYAVAIDKDGAEEHGYTSNQIESVSNISTSSNAVTIETEGAEEHGCTLNKTEINSTSTASSDIIIKEQNFISFEKLLKGYLAIAYNSDHIQYKQIRESFYNIDPSILNQGNKKSAFIFILRNTMCFLDSVVLDTTENSLKLNMEKLEGVYRKPQKYSISYK